MRSVQSRKRRKADVAERASTPNAMWAYCRIIGCGQPTRIGAGNGLNYKYCRKHEDHFQRHGSYVQPSLTAAKLAPWRKAARAFLKANLHDTTIASAVAAIRGLYSRSGPAVETFRLRGLSPAQRASALWATLRESRTDPIEPLAAWLAVEAAVATDPQCDKKLEFKRVQAAKLIHRMAGGSHRRWERERADGQIEALVLHKYPHSRGLVLRHIGEQVATTAEFLPARHLIRLIEATGSRLP